MVTVTKKISDRLGKIGVILLFLSLTAPSRSQKFEMPVVDPAMSGYVLSFIRDAKKFNAHPKMDAIGLIAFGKIPTGYVGFCYNADQVEYTNGHRYSRLIMVSEKVRKYPTSLAKSIIYHELGHCALDRNHDPDNSYSIMGPALMPEGETAKSMTQFNNAAWDALVFDFFTRYEIFPPPSKQEFLDQ